MSQTNTVVNEREQVATITFLVRHAFQLFQGTKSAIGDNRLQRADLTHFGRVEDLHGRFRVWAGNVAAHRSGNSSLDYRLRDASHLRQRVFELLHELGDNLENATAIANGSKIPWDEKPDSDVDSNSDEGTEPEPLSELSQIMETLSEVITCLFQLSMSIRNPVPHDHIINSASDPTSSYEGFDKNHVQSKHPSADHDLVERMGKAITRRRSYLKYRESRHSRLARGIIDVDSGLANTIQGGSTVATSLPPEVAVGEDRDAPDSDPFSLGDIISQTSFATSASGNRSMRPPPPPPESRNGQAFECPLCFYIITVSSKTSWERHVFEDLRPYICTFPDCETPSKLYTSQHLWFEHELLSHRSTWKCPRGCPESFTAFGRLQRHMSKSHGDNDRRDDLAGEDLNACRQEISVLASSICPLCGDALRGLKWLRKHIGKHQQQLALFALPLGLFPEVDDSDSGDVPDDLSLNSDEEEATKKAKAAEERYPKKMGERTAAAEEAAKAKKGPRRRKRQATA